MAKRMLVLLAACTTTWRSASVRDLGEHRHAFVVTDDRAFELTVEASDPKVEGTPLAAWTFSRANAGPIYKDEDPLPIARRLNWTHVPTPSRVHLDAGSIRYVRVEVREGPSSGAVGALIAGVVVAGLIGLAGWAMSVTSDIP